MTFWEHANVSWVDDFLTVPSYLAALYLLVRMVTPRTHQLPPTTRRFALGASHQLSDLRILGHGTMAVVLAMECLFPFFGKASVFDPMDCVMYVASNVLTYVLLGCAWWPNAGGRRK